MTIETVFETIKSFPQAEALALGGSRSCGNEDDKSDYDLYVYGAQIVPDEVREKGLIPLCSEAEIGNRYFESEDNIVLKDGTHVDIIYRRTEDFEHMMTRLLDDCKARNGYTTCFWHNIRTCRIIFDKNGRFTRLHEKARCPYPEELKNAIIKRNMALLTGTLPSYDEQIKKAYYRHDYVSVNHRVAAFLESYFDVIFAVNELPHPGEKRLVALCERDCEKLPANFKENLMQLFQYMFQYDVSDIIENMLTELKKIV